MISIPGRIPIIIYPVFWVLVIILGWLNSQSIQGIAIWAVVIFFSVLIHEYGHALTALAFGQKVEINLVGLGGLTKRRGETLPRWKEFLIVLNGPLAGFGLFFIAYYLLPIVRDESSILSYAFIVAMNVNLFWTILNLIPVLPLDGGHLMRIIFEGLFGVKGMKLSYLISVFLAGLIAIYFFLIQQILVGALFIMLAFESYRAWVELKSLQPIDENQDLQRVLQEGIKDLQSSQLNEALEKFTYIRHQAPKGVLFVKSSQFGARILSQQGDYKKAYDWLFPLQNRLDIEYLQLFQQLAYRLEEWEKCIEIGQQAYQINPSLETALISSYANAILGRANAAIGWLRCSLQEGLPDIHQVVQKKEFDRIRDSEAFQEFLKSL
ncbi:MAG: site-2 protease family protein [Parachlamydiaceae bacterium]|nr:site-2 protease family protein [Parachlamydiaceae bacterium]